MTILDDNVAALTVQVNALLATITQNQGALNAAVAAAQAAASAAQASAILASSSVPPRLALAGIDLLANSLCYVRSDGALALSDASTQGREAICFVKSAYTTGQTVTYYTAGNVIPGLAGLVPNAYYFMSTIIGGFGLLSATPQVTGVVMVVGKALSSTELLFQPGPAITL